MGKKWVILWQKLPVYARIALFVLLLIFVFGNLMTWIEPETYPTLFDGLWWTVVTISTVGFGDLVPKTVLGKMTGMIIILLGAAFATAFFAAFAAAAVELQNGLKRGKLMFKDQNHVVIVGWNAKSAEIVRSMLKASPSQPIVLIDQTLEESPNDQLHFIKGPAIQDQTLMQANITKAKSIVITSDHHKNETDADMQTILVILGVKGISPDTYTIAEIQTSHQAVNAKRAGADEIVKTFELSSHIMVNGILHKHSIKESTEMMNPGEGKHIEVDEIPASLHDVPFKELSLFFLEQNSILLGIKRGEELYYNPPAHFSIRQGDQAILFIC
ncbi:potassium channel protein [Bacillus sp. FJAT-42376]|uniref:potassium channel family protein n=1 Tax=Bacillus sp. FJAT-42376 TaxID=2014076 RepID=UPI000F50A223|nr:potassium channel family protein [Bacillus sp. FJAT-42376]AZB44200.1 potassium channel protein [Bacillus sp. FJAT-42376]